MYRSPEQNIAAIKRLRINMYKSILHAESMTDSIRQRNLEPGSGMQQLMFDAIDQQLANACEAHRHFRLRVDWLKQQRAVLSQELSFI